MTLHSIFRVQQQDVFHIGQVTYEIANGFSCSVDELWREKYVKSPSELSNNNVSVSYPMLINREGA